MYELKIVPSKPALILDGTKKILVITDLHIGFEDSIFSHPGFINRTTDEIISDIENIIDETKPHSLIILGDIKSSICKTSSNERHDIPFFFEVVLFIISVYY